MEKVMFYTGTFTEYMYVTTFDLDTMKAEVVGRVHVPRRSAYFALSLDKSKLYVANENQGSDGGVSVLDLSDPYLPRLVQTVNSGSQGPAHISLAQVDGKCFVLGSGYFDADVTIYPIQSDGLLENISCRVLFNKGGHAHGIQQFPRTSYVIATDTGNSELHSYRLGADGKLDLCNALSHPEVQAQRHIAFAQKSDYVYVLTEKTSTVAVFHLERNTGSLTYLQSISTLPTSWIGKSSGAAIHCSNDGKFLYCSNRGHDSIAVFAITDGGARLTIQGYLHEGVVWPREFTIDPTGQYMLIANERSNNISINRINPNTGIPTYLGEKIELEAGPICILFYQSDLDYQRDLPVSNK